MVLRLEQAQEYEKEPVVEGALSRTAHKVLEWLGPRENQPPKIETGVYKNSQTTNVQIGDYKMEFKTTYGKTEDLDTQTMTMTLL
jgi:hypothetical protein